MKPKFVAVIVSVVLSFAGVTACTSSPAQQPDQQAAQTYLDAFSNHNVAAAAAGTSDSAAAVTALKSSLDGLGANARPTFTITSVSDRKDTTSTAHYSASWTFPGAPRPWTYDGALSMVKPADSWLVKWDPTAVFPTLAVGQHLDFVRTQPTRAPLLDAAGQPLFTEQTVIDVSLDPAKITDLPALAAALGAVLNIPAATIISTVQATPKGQAAAVTTLSQATYDQVKPQIYDLPGTQFAKRTALRGPTSTYGQPLLGQVGSPTKEVIDQSNGAIAAGDVTGTSGLQRALNNQLAGTPGFSIQAVTDANGAAGPVFAELSKPTPGTAVTLTLNRADQNAAETALATVSQPASIVVTQPSTGKVLAVANSAAADGDIALTGQYPPGSTFKIVTYTAAFTNNPALSPETLADCPGSINVNGQTVTNENSFAMGRIPLSAAFAFSCNTTAAELGLALPDGALLKAAQSLGLGAKWTLPVDAFSGTLSPPTTPNDKAATAYGQGRTLVSPLLMAEIAGAASTGRPVAPSLTVGQQATPGDTQPATVTAYLNAIMRDVVAQPGATARDLAGLPGPVEGKTGTAEFGTANPPGSHAWFAGTRGDLAFSVFVYGGGNSSSGSVPIVKTLLSNVP
jgi:cell division protein FtsI/penicillin-binding protein 2